jgi:hypothetical protein
VASIFKIKEKAKQKANVKQVPKKELGFLGFFFFREDGGDMFLRNVRCFQWTAWRYILEDRTLHYLFAIFRLNLNLSLCGLY